MAASAKQTLKGEYSFKAPKEEGEGEDTFVMRLDTNAFCEIEEALGLTLPELMAHLNQAPSLRLYRGVVYGALFHHHGLTIEQCGDLIQRVGIEKMTAHVNSLVESVMPEAKERVGNAPAPNRAQRRAQSGRGKQPGKGGVKLG
jgi:hypothetical protein